jgi:predicted GIY-YIG superfamily endonuclease
MQGVYLIHFEPAYKHARHYLGYADDIAARLALHRAGQGARLTQVAADAGCKIRLVKVWPGADRHFERKLKNRKESPRLCPICNGQLDFSLDNLSELEF